MASPAACHQRHFQSRDLSQRNLGQGPAAHPSLCKHTAPWQSAGGGRGSRPSPYAPPVCTLETHRWGGRRHALAYLSAAGLCDSRQSPRVPLQPLEEEATPDRLAAAHSAPRGSGRGPGGGDMELAVEPVHVLKSCCAAQASAGRAGEDSKIRWVQRAPSPCLGPHPRRRLQRLRHAREARAKVARSSPLVRDLPPKGGMSPRLGRPRCPPLLPVRHTACASPGQGGEVRAEGRHWSRPRTRQFSARQLSRL